MSTFSQVLRLVLSKHNPKGQSIMEIGRWKVFFVDKIDDQNNKVKKIVYEITGNVGEKIMVLLIMSNTTQVIENTKYYYLKSSTDEQLAFFISRSFLERISRDYDFSKHYQIKEMCF